ncbi:MAG: hypothetical protein U1D30_02215 [Planctomycetota bacterium]
MMGTKGLWAGVFALGTLCLNLGCSRENGTPPSTPTTSDQKAVADEPNAPEEKKKQLDVNIDIGGGKGVNIDVKSKKE